ESGGGSRIARDDPHCCLKGLTTSNDVILSVLAKDLRHSLSHADASEYLSTTFAVHLVPDEFGLAALLTLDRDLAELLLVTLDELRERHRQSLGVGVAQDRAVGHLEEQLGAALGVGVWVGHVEAEVD